MAEVFPRDILFRVGGRTLARFGVPAVAGAGRSVKERIEAFTRAGTAMYLDRGGVLRTAAADVPRVHWHPGLVDAIGNPLAALLAEGASRQNVLIRNTEWDNAAWIVDSASVTANATTAPDGTVTADKLVEDSTASVGHGIKQDKTGLTDNILDAWSLWLRAAERTWVRVETVDKAGTITRSWFDLSAGTWGTVGHANKFLIETATGGWFRIGVTRNIGSGATTPSFRVYLATGNDNLTYNGDGVSGLYVWGGQVEAGAFPSSTILTTTASVTRAAETIDLPIVLPMAIDWTIFFWVFAQHSVVSSWPDTEPQTDPFLFSLHTTSGALDTDNSGNMALHRQNAGAQYEWEYFVNRGTAARTFTPPTTPTAQKLVLRHYASDHHLDLAIDGSAFAAGGVPSTVTIAPLVLARFARPNPSGGLYGLIDAVAARGLHTQAEMEAVE